MIADYVNDQIDVVGRAFLGITVACARCHDHKFDPISLKDYYGMAGIFASTRTINGRLGLGVFSNVNTVTLPELPEEMQARATETTEYWRNLEAARAQQSEVLARMKTMELLDAAGVERIKAMVARAGDA